MSLICVPVSDTYSDYREQLLQPEECAAALAEYGEIVGLPVNDQEFIKHLRGQLTDTANKVDQEYPANACFNIVDGRATLAKLVKKPVPDGFNAIHDALNRKLQALDLSMLDALADTMHWLQWARTSGR